VKNIGGLWVKHRNEPLLNAGLNFAKRLPLH
jgi:hypothetical protein